MPFSLQDIVAVLTLAHKIHQWGSSRYTSAIQEYRDFMRDVENLETALRAIQTEAQRFQALPNSPNLDLSLLDTAVDEVYDTLRRCERLLRENSSFQWRDGRFIYNVLWNLDIAQHVKTLQTRITFHCTKVNLIVQPLQLQIHSSLGQRISIFHEDMDAYFEQLFRRIPGSSASTGRLQNVDFTSQLPVVPAQVAVRFASRASSNGAASSFSIQDGLNAVVFQYEKSTREFIAEPPTLVRPSVIQYLSLLKCVWVMQKLREMPSYKNFCEEIMCKAYIRQLERKLEREFQRFDGVDALQAPELAEILQMADDEFEILPDLGAIDTAPALTEASNLEIKVFETPLEPRDGNKTENLTVFRVGESRLRFTIVVTSPHVTASEKTNYELDCRTAVVAPVYAHPSNQSSYSLTWKAASAGSRTEELPFKSLQSLWQFQEAVTNFGVSRDVTGLTAVRAKLSMWDGRIGTELGGISRAQFWIYRKPHRTPYQRRESVTSNTTSEGSSTRAWSRDYLSQTNPGSSIRSTGTGAYLDTPVPAQLVIFTLLKGHLRLISIEIDEHIRIDPSLCSCDKKANTCERIVIKNESSEKIRIKVYDARDDRDKFNVAVLGNPKHESVNDHDNVESSKAKFVNIEMNSIKNRERFRTAFTDISNIMQNKMYSYRQDLSNMRNRHVHEGG